jgi:hypothetical protein
LQRIVAAANALGQQVLNLRLEIATRLADIGDRLEAWRR